MQFQRNNISCFSNFEFNEACLLWIFKSTKRNRSTWSKSMSVPLTVDLEIQIKVIMVPGASSYQIITNKRPQIHCTCTTPTKRNGDPGRRCTHYTHDSDRPWLAYLPCMSHTSYPPLDLNHLPCLCKTKNYKSMCTGNCLWYKTVVIFMRIIFILTYFCQPSYYNWN